MLIFHLLSFPEVALATFISLFYILLIFINIISLNSLLGLLSFTFAVFMLNNETI